MGSVHEPEQPAMRRRVALKILDTSASFDPSDIKRFEREAWIGGRISHPNVVKVLDSGEDSACRWIALELVEGGTLAEWIDEDQRSQSTGGQASAIRRDRMRRMVKLLVGVADALAHVHAQGIVHRDVKPLNMLATKERDRLLLTDFGLARDPEASRLTQRGDFMGTLRYMSPEQLLAHRVPVDDPRMSGPSA